MIGHPRSIRFQITALVVVLLVGCCAILVLLMSLSATVTLDTVELQLAGQESVSIQFDAEALKEDILSDTVTYFAIVVAVGSIAAYFLVGRYTKPIRQLSERMRETGPEALSQRVELSGGGEETEELVRSFNEMTQQLDEAFAMQRRFSASAAHELRTPLAVLQTKLDVFRKRPRSREEYEGLLDVVGTNIRRLSDVVSNLLELTETGELPNKEDVSLDALLGRVRDDLSPLARGRNVSLSLAGAGDASGHEGQEPHPARVLGNANLLYRVFFNLVENAIRYNHEGGDVTMEVSQTPDATCVTVADTGEGVDASQRELVFEPFFRVNKSRSRSFGGAGIGLSLVRSILARHGASVTCEANLPRGTAFVVRFPTKPCS